MILLNCAIPGDMELTEEQIALSDCNDDGLADPLMMLKYIVELIPSLQAKFK